MKTGANVFLTGEPGSGKTHTINNYISYLKEHCIDMAVTASTGIAATHIGGMTIHSWSGIGIKNRLDKYTLDQITSNEYVVKRVRKTKVLIIDEVSMLGPETLMMVDAVCREIKQTSEPFGGLQVILVGDFFQLPPVEKSDNVGVNGRLPVGKVASPQKLFEQPKIRFAYESPVWNRLNPIVCYLTEQHRQDDHDFLGVLNAIRSNSFEEQHLNHIEKRKVGVSGVPDRAPKLYSHNFDVDRMNNEMLREIKSEAQEYNMTAQGPTALVASLKRGCLSPEKLALKIGAEVMFTKNNSKEGYVNGTLGTVEEFDDFSNLPIVITKDGQKIMVEPDEWTVEEIGRVKAKISQIPLRLAWAITVHKSQGMSLDEAVVDLSQVFEYGQGYVALSRVRRLKGLHLLGWNDHAFKVHPDVLTKDFDFRANSAAARDAFAKVSPAELKKMRENFILASGGVVVEDSEVQNNGHR